MGPVTLEVKRTGKPDADVSIGPSVISTTPIDSKLQVKSATYTLSGKVLVPYAGE